MRILLIEGTAKQKKSASSVLLAGLREQLQGAEISEHALRNAQLCPEVEGELLRSDAVVLIVPVYVDAIPSHLVAVLEQIEKRLGTLKEKPVIYVVMNCGFYEGEHCEIAVAMLRHWCDHCGAAFGGSVAVGAGGALTGLEMFPMGSGPKKTLGKALETFAQHVLKKESADPVFISLDLKWDEYKRIGETGWRKACQKRGVSEGMLSAPCPMPEQK